MMHALVLLHRWLGVAVCLFFAMWFASGIVMHFVAFPELTEAQRFAGLPQIDFTRLRAGPAAAVAASGMIGVTRLRLMRRSDEPVYIVGNGSSLKALRAEDLADAAVRSESLALAIAAQYARRVHPTDGNAATVERAFYDQWTVSGRFDRHRPLYRVALNDGDGTEIYVSSTTGEVVQQTTRRQRLWNYAGSVPHWIYLVALRRHGAVWTGVVWSLALAALLCALAGAALGILRIGANRSARRGWQAWHHWAGLVCMSFVLTYIFSGWLSMDSGLLFATGKPTGHEAAIVSGSPDWSALTADERKPSSEPISEIEWFAFDGKIHRRERTGLSSQHLTPAPTHQSGASPEREFLSVAELDALAPKLASGCSAAAVVERDDAHSAGSIMPDAPVLRLRCGNVWFDVDGATGGLLSKLGPSRRLYRWLFDGLHALDFPVFMRRPPLRTALVVVLCGGGFVFSLTGVVLAARLVGRSVRRSRRPQMRAQE